MAVLFWPALVALVIASFYLGRKQAVTVANGKLVGLHSLPTYHGLLSATAALVCALAIFIVGSLIVSSLSVSNALSFFPPEALTELQRGATLRDVVNLATNTYQGQPSPQLEAAAASYRSTQAFGGWAILLVALGVGAAAVFYLMKKTSLDFRARNKFEASVKVLLIICAAVAVLTTIGIVLSVTYETFRFFFDPSLRGRPTVTEFLFGTQWSPQGALRADQAGQSSFGFLPLLTGTLLITVIAMLVAGPIGLFAAIYMSEYATPRIRAFAKPILEVLAGVPTVVLGFFAALTVAPLIRSFGESVGLNVASESALAAGLVMGMMIIPFVSSLSDDVINSVPQSLRDGAYAMGSTKSETIKRVVLPAALPGIVSAFMLAISRAIGETMIVVMAAGLAANLTLNPLDAVTTITVQIKTILVGDQEFDSAKTLAAFALGFVLFFFTLILNVIALRIVAKYREQYD